MSTASDNVFEHDVASDVASMIAENNSRATQSPVSVATSKAVPALSILYVIPYLLFFVFTVGVVVSARILRFYNVRCRKHRCDNNQNESSRSEDHHERRRRRRSNSTGNSADDPMVTQNHRERRRSSLPEIHHPSFQTGALYIGDSSVVSLGRNDRIRLYHQTFQRNKNCKILKSEDFCDAINCGLDIESSGEFLNPNSGTNRSDDSENTPWIYLPLTSPKAKRCRKLKKAFSPSDDDDEIDDSDDDVDDDENDEDSSKDDNDSLHKELNSSNTSVTDTLTTSPSTDTAESLIKVPGHCVVCFENFKTGDTIVWSDDTATCKHVYHEDCMVRYLAANSLRKKRSNAHNRLSLGKSYSDNPCPTCRQQFCKVRHDDIVMAVLLKSVAVALGEEEEELPLSSRSGEGAPFSSYDRGERIAATSMSLTSAATGMSSAEVSATVGMSSISVASTIAMATAEV